MLENMVVHRPDGAALAVQVGGPAAGPTMVLLQGQASSHRWWSDLRGRYEDRFRTVTLDYRGTGDTTAPPGDLTTTELAGDVAGVLDALDVTRAHVYGTSMGGRIAQVLAAGHPTRVESLVLASTSPGGPNATERGPRVRHALSHPDPAERQAALAALFFTPAWTGDPATCPLLGDPTMTPHDRQRHLRMSARHDADALLPHITAPTLVLHGSADLMTPAVNAERLAARIPGARLVVHPGGRHGFFAEFADDVDHELHLFWHRHADG